MSGNTAVATIEHIAGETFSFGIRSEPEYLGTETVICDIKPAKNGNQVPERSVPAAISLTPVFIAENGDDAAHWLMTVTSSASAALEPGNYITDCKITYASGAVDYPRPLKIIILERVTE